MNEQTYGTCKNCKFWYHDWGNVCDRASDRQVRKGPKKFALETSAEDNQELEYWLETGPDFGCAHFEIK